VGFSVKLPRRKSGVSSSLLLSFEFAFKLLHGNLIDPWREAFSRMCVMNESELLLPYCIRMHFYLIQHPIRLGAE